MKVFLFADKIPPQVGGMETHALYFAQSFSKTDDLTVISKKNDDDIVVDNIFEHPRHLDLFEFLKEFSTEKCLVFFNSGRWIEQLNAIRKALPRAVFFYRTGGNEIEKAPLSITMGSHRARQDYWAKTINENVDRLISNSSFTTKRLIRQGVAPSIISIVRGGICPEAVFKAVKNGKAFRNSLGLGTEEKMLVCCCRFVPYKRVDFLLNAFSLLTLPARLYLVGDGPLMEQTRQHAEELLLKNVCFVGRCSHEKSLEYISAADVYCQASSDLVVKVDGGEYIHTEGMGRSLIEAICCGTRVCVTGAGAVDEYIHEENGMVVEGGEAEFAAGIEKVLGMPGIPLEKSLEYIRAFDFERIFDLYRALM